MSGACRVTVVGLGRLGAPLVATLAAAGHTVHAVDRDSERVDAVATAKSGRAEPLVDDLLAEHAGSITATTDLTAAVQASDATLVVVATPTAPDGSFSLEQVEPAIRSVGSARQGRPGHLVGVLSTVSPLAMGGAVKQALEEASGHRVGDGVALAYLPEFFALGHVVHDLRRPAFVLVGAEDRRTGERAEALLRPLWEVEPTVHHRSFVDAEVAKLALNTFVTTKISFANSLAALCERLPGASVDEVTTAIAADPRVGGKAFTGALPFGGPCFPRDNAAMRALSASLGLTAHLALATEAANAEARAALFDLVAATEGVVGLAGMAFKPGTDVTVASPGADLAAALLRAGREVLAYDPLADHVPGLSVQWCETPEALVRRSDVLVLLDPTLGAGVDLTDRRSPGVGRVVVDCWRRLDPATVPPGVVVLRPGTGRS